MEDAPRIKDPKVKRTPEPEGPAISRDEFLSLKEPKGDVIVDIDGERVSLTSLDRVYWPEQKITKYELLRYYLLICSHIMPFLENRPAILQRYPRGIKAPKFFQHDLQSAPEYVKAVRMPNEQGREIDYAVYTDIPSLLHLVNLGTIEQHPWSSRIDSLNRPDWLALDLDPRGAPWENVLKSALAAKEIFDKRNLKAYPKTSGSSGIHLYLPLERKYEFEQVHDFAHELAEEIANHAPDIATIERSIADRREGQVYVDWLQNSRGKSMAAPFSARAKPGATVSMPLTWDQVEKGVEISDFTIRNVPELVEKHGDAWDGFFSDRQGI